MPKKKFIDKKHSTTFVLGHRGQRDPLLADETAPQNILIPLAQVPNLSRGGVSAETSAGGSNANSKQLDPEKRIEEQRKYGVYFDDDYDYLQHLKDSDEVSTMKWDVVERIYAPNVKPDVQETASSTVAMEDLDGVKIKLPSSVFESEYKEEVGLLNKGAPSFGPRPDLDPDVVAALDEDFDFENPENELEDNFMELANDGLDEELEREPTAEELEGLFSDEEEDVALPRKGDASKNHASGSESDYEDEKDDSVGSLDGRRYSFSDEETKSHFTNYSMSSSVVRRNKQLLLVDERFEKMFEGYEDTEIGALDLDEIEGDIHPESDLLLKYAEEFEKDKKEEDELNNKIVSLAVNDESDDTMSESSDEEEPKEKWDCQSIISTYSTTKNRPKIIREVSKKNLIRVSGRTGMPVGVLGKGGLTKDNLKMLNAENNEDNRDERMERAKSIMSGATSIRNKNETPQERRDRKMLVKEHRKERRLEKKANSEAFKEEKKRIEKVRLNVKANVQGLKL